MKNFEYEYNKDRMALIYFSGTGNTKLIANRIAENLKIQIINIENNYNFEKLFSEIETLIIMYPVYYSTPPIIIREFLNKYRENLENKNIMSLVTQMCFSGDGAYVIRDYLPKSANLIYSRHIDMPSNISNLPILPFFENFLINFKIHHALKKSDKISIEIKNGNLKTQGNTNFGNKMGLSQRIGGLEKESEKRNNLWIDDTCIACGLCVKNCPVNNLFIENKIAHSKGSCIFCTRCENICSKKSIRVLLDRKVKYQYKLPKKFLNNYR
ncbi:EFR1 family ferrodoxin [Peptoniphilus grossensis]|uniref:EFR1 family ferrodoxin n=1 Tax=Peptoniphilus grossensis TaxID=1465756 RepID=UPI00399B060F